MHSPPCAPFSGARRAPKRQRKCYAKRKRQADAVVKLVEAASELRWSKEDLCPAVVVVENSPKVLDREGFAYSGGYQRRLLQSLERPERLARKRGFAGARMTSAILDPGAPASRRRWWAGVRLRAQ